MLGLLLERSSEKCLKDRNFFVIEEKLEKECGGALGVLLRVTEGLFDVEAWLCGGTLLNS